MGKDNKSSAALMLFALGVVFGDIGTSPLYALRECFGPHAHLPLTESAILGVLSLVIWSLIIIISIKYLGFVMKAHNKGEGGVLALTALIVRKLRKGGKPSNKITSSAVIIGIFGAALLYADGVITPAISVISAIEGVSVITPVFNPYIIPCALVILVCLFAIQSQGTATIGKFFGPLVLIWFLVIGALGAIKVFDTPQVLYAFNPVYALLFFRDHGFGAFVSLGALFLAVTGAEALYADMGHFSIVSISRAWFYIVFPALLLNYLGQAALLLENPAAISNPFYLLAPKSLLIPLVILATLTSAVASQAVISGAFSLTRQAIQLGYLPRMLIQHTSATHQGQIYVPAVNLWLGFGTLVLVLMFKTSSNLAAAYGIAVSSTMLLTTLLMFIVCLKVWKWNAVVAFLVCGVFALGDLAFLSANCLKFVEGGWFPVLIGILLFTLMTTWAKGRKILASRLEEKSVPWDEFKLQLEKMDLRRVVGTSVFLSRSSSSTPVPLIHNVRHNQVLHENILLLTIQTEGVPFVKEEDRLRIINLENGFYRVIASMGFQEEPDISKIIKICREKGLPIDERITYFLGREILIPSSRPGMAIWREKLFALTSRNAQRATTFYKVPSEQVFEVGIQIEL